MCREWSNAEGTKKERNCLAHTQEVRKLSVFDILWAGDNDGKGEKARSPSLKVNKHEKHFALLMI
jgi:hypothetical protein